MYQKGHNQYYCRLNKRNLNKRNKINPPASVTPSNYLNVLSKTHKFKLDVIYQIDDPIKQKDCFEKLC